MVTFSWWVESVSWRVEWKCAMTNYGAQCAMTFGTLLTLVLLVDSLDSPALV